MDSTDAAENGPEGVHTGCRAILAVDLGAEFTMSLGRRNAHDLSMLFGEIKDVTEKLAIIAAKVDATDGIDSSAAADDVG